jgi:dihydrodipicolinate synthase/N-acetylneuraminate lyase
MQAGADGLFVMPPMGAGDITASWNPTRYPEVWIDMVKETISAAGGDMPVLCHPTSSISMAYGNGFPMESTVRMCQEIPNIVGWKMTYNYDGYRTVARALRQLDRHVGILAAPGVYFHENLASRQFDGTVSGSFNYSLEPMIDHINAWRRGDVEEACRIWDGGLSEIHEYVYGDFSRLHIRYKTAAWLRGVISNPFMVPPMPKPRREEVRTLHRLLSRAGLGVISTEEAERVAAALQQ